MNVRQIAKIGLLTTVTVLASSCLEKTDSLSADTKNASNSLWQWDDQQKSWFYNGSLYQVKGSPSTKGFWKKQENAIVLQIESGKALTAFDNAPKGLQMKVFQLSDSTAFLKAASSSSGLKHLLITEQIDSAIVGMERVFVLPGISQTITLDRQENARYIGIVLGYSAMQQEKIARLVPIVMLDDDDNNTKRSLLASINSDPENNTAKSPKKLHPAILKMDLLLEGNGIKKLDINVK